MTVTCTKYLNGAEPAAIQTAADLLRAGETVAFATETVYGLGALGLSPEAVEKIYAAKGRPAHNPLIFHVSSVGQAFQLWASEPTFERRARLLMQHFWPGPLTLVGPKAAHVPAIACAGLPTVAVRMPAHSLALELLRAVGEPVVAPSANASNRPSSTCANHVMATLAGRISAILDGGSCAVGLESTIVDLTGEQVVVLRLGSIAATKLAEVLGEAVIDGTTSTKITAPGQMHKHYAPLIEQVVLVSSMEQLRQTWMTSSALLLRHSTAQRLRKELGERDALIQELPDDAEAYAQELYAAFYALEEQQPAMLMIEDCSSLKQEHALWNSIRDRLARASA